MNNDLSNDILSAIFFHSQQGVIVIDYNYIIEAINPKAEEFLSTTSSFSTGRKLIEVCPEFFVRDKIIEGIITLTNGTKINTRLLELAVGKINPWFVLFLEIILEEEKWDLLSNVINSIDDAVLVCDHTGQLIVYNDANSRMDGLLREQVLGKHVTSVYRLTEAQSLLLQAMEQRKPILNRHQSYTTFQHRNLDIMCSTFPLFQNHQVIGAVSIMKDYSQMKLLSDRVIELQGQLYGKVNKPLTKKLTPNAKYTFDNLIGSSSCILQSINWAKKASRSSSHVLIYGETGTGKELFAQSIHNASSKATNPFIAINCAAIPENLLEGILFGTVKGAYTGSVDRPGLFEQADGGTLLLDEMNSMSFALQSKLLRVLQEGTIRRLGDIIEIAVDVRIISNINTEPYVAIKEKQLRADLYYRLSAVYLEIPPLRSRVEDIPLLAEAFIKMYNSSLGRNINGISSEGMGMLRDYSWPGNVREFQNAIESAMNNTDENEKVLFPLHFPAHIRKRVRPCSADTINISVPLKDETLVQILQQLERIVISHVLQKNKWNVSRAAKQLDIKRQSLQYRIRKYGLRQSNNSV